MPRFTPNRVGFGALIDAPSTARFLVVKPTLDAQTIRFGRLASIDDVPAIRDGGTIQFVCDRPRPEVNPCW